MADPVPPERFVVDGHASTPRRRLCALAPAAPRLGPPAGRGWTRLPRSRGADGRRPPGRGAPQRRPAHARGPPRDPAHVVPAERFAVRRAGGRRRAGREPRAARSRGVGAGDPGGEARIAPRRTGPAVRARAASPPSRRTGAPGTRAAPPARLVARAVRRPDRARDAAGAAGPPLRRSPPAFRR